MGEDRLQAVIAGHICLDITPHFRSSDERALSEILTPGKLVSMGGVDLSPGGAAANTGLALSVMGIQSTLMGKVGKDPFAGILDDLLRQWGVGGGLIAVDDARTSYTVVIAPPGTDRIFLHDSGANDTFVASDIPYQDVARAQLFHFGYPPIMERMYSSGGKELVSMLARVKEAGVTTSLDMALPDPSSAAGQANWEAILARSLPYVDIFLPSLEEILFMLDRPAYDELRRRSAGSDMMDAVDLDILAPLAESLLERGAGVVGIKCGKLGFFLATAARDRIRNLGAATPRETERWEGRRLFAETYVVDTIRSTTGAGDSSIAGFLAAFLERRDPEQALRVACAAGANTTRVYDTVSGVESLARMEEWIATNPPRNRLSEAGSHWSFDESLKLWICPSGRS